MHHVRRQHVIETGRGLMGAEEMVVGGGVALPNS